MIKLLVDGRPRRVLLDTGCTDNIVYAPFCAQWQQKTTNIKTISGDYFQCVGVGNMTVETSTGQRAQVHTLVMNEPPLGVDAVLGIAGVTALGGVVVKSPTDVQFCGNERVCGATSTAPLVVDAPDFSVQFNATQRTWTVTWKWTDGKAPDCLQNTVAQYNVPTSMRREFDEELGSWIQHGWLVPYDEVQHGAQRGLVPLMAVRQNNGGKVRPVLDYRELNDHVTAFTADSDVCADQLRKWRRHGVNVTVLDLRKAYLQLRVEQQLWPFQIVMVRGQRYCLTRLGFGLNVAPLVMKAVVKTILAQDPEIERAVLPYVDDLLVNEDIVCAEQVSAHFAAYGLECKKPCRAEDGARLLGLHVQSCDGQLWWTRDNTITPPPTQVTRRSIFAWCGRLVAHMPLGGWLRPAAAWLKRRANEVTQGWNDAVKDDSLRDHMRYVAARLATEDPCHGAWCVRGDRAVVWTDASSLASGIVVETPQGVAIEDACWLRRQDDTTHINMAELDAAVRGVNLAIAWGMKHIELRTDSATVHRWLDDALSGRARLRTKAHGEMLIRRRVEVIRQLVTEFSLALSVTLVRSAENRADVLTRVPVEWMRSDKTTVAAAEAEGEPDVRPSIADLHVSAGHPGIRRTLYFARRELDRVVTRAEVRDVVKKCDVCRCIDPAPVKWRQGSLGVEETWWRLAIDITHHVGRDYLSIIDCGPSRFCVWRQLRRADSDTVVKELEQVFFERGAPVEVLLDNDTVFRGRQFSAFARRWGVFLRFRAAYAASGNGIVERNHRTVKVIAARKHCSIPEAVHLYNITPRDGATATEAPANAVYRHRVRDRVCSSPEQPAEVSIPSNDGSQKYSLGDAVWIRKRGERCTSVSQPGIVTRVNSPQVVEVDGMPRHVRDVRHRDLATLEDSESTHSDSDEAKDDPPLYIDVRMQQVQGQPRQAPLPQRTVAAEPTLRRSTRMRRPPQRYCCDLVDQGGV